MVTSADELAFRSRDARKAQSLTEMDVAGLGNTATGSSWTSKTESRRWSKKGDGPDGLLGCSWWSGRKVKINGKPRVTELSVFYGERLVGTIHDTSPLRST